MRIVLLFLIMQLEILIDDKNYPTANCSVWVHIHLYAQESTPHDMGIQKNKKTRNIMLNEN